MIAPLLLIALGVSILYAGGEVLVRSSTALANNLRINPLIVGLTVVAFGTSAPELAVAVAAAVQGSPDIAVGNVVGSNIANIGLILGLTVMLTPLAADRSFVRREVPFMIGTAFILIPFVLTGTLGRAQALGLLALLAGFLWVLVRTGAMPTEEAEQKPRGNLWPAVLGSVAGLILLVGGARLLVTAAVDLARDFGVSDRVIGLTVVAFGTSVPELAGCLVAAARKQVGLILGNIIGSNVFNTLLILPVAMLIHPIPVAFAETGIDLLVMLGFSVALLAFFWGGNRLNRAQGTILFLGYLAYVGYLATLPTPGG